MPLLLLILLGGVLVWSAWRYRTTTLTRDCRWREDRMRGLWRCAFCGAEAPGPAMPRDCLRGTMRRDAGGAGAPEG